MERLTYDFAIGENHCWEVHGADNLTCEEVCKGQGDNGCENCPIRKVIDRLAAYEDTGLEPEEVVALQASFQELKKEAVPLMQAKIDGRLVVLPCKPGDTVWFKTYSKNATVCLGVCPHEVSRFDISAVVPGEYTDTDLPLHEFGKSVFLTREEALAERQAGADDQTQGGR